MDDPPSYDQIVPPRVFAPVPRSSSRPRPDDHASSLSSKLPNGGHSRTRLVRSEPSGYQNKSFPPPPRKEKGRWRIFAVGSWQRNPFRLRKSSDVPNWKPISLRPPFLLSVIGISIILVIVLQLLLLSSERNGGIIFAKNINTLPLRVSFPYLYLPTIIAVSYGMLWNWIDLDVRRLEPFLQMAKNEGANGQESLLLHYPVDFLASVPIKAMKRGHWSVFTASIATILVFWGITPTQSGIFATNTLIKTIEVPSLRSTTFPSLSQQGETLSAASAQSVASIMWLNETLQPFMTRDYVLAPFGPTNALNLTAKSGNWTAHTLKYSVDVTCETPVFWTMFDLPMVNSSWGCHFRLPLPDVTTNVQNASKVFDTVYAGFFNEDGLADYYLSGYCPPSESNSFLIQWSKTIAPVSFNDSASLSAQEQLQHVNMTTLYCRSNYNFQEVEATVRLPSNEVLGYQPVGQLQPLPSDVFNTSNFEAAMNMGHERFRVRTNFPTTNWPSQTAFLANIPLDLRHLSTMAPFAIGATQLPLEHYLDPDNLANSYQSAYRLLFARQLANVLSKSLDPNSETMGRWTYQTQSVVLVPAFTYIVEALLVVSVVFAMMILYISGTRVSKLHSDPATIAAVMSLTADDSMLLGKLKLMDQASEKELQFSIRHRRFRLQLGQGSDSGYRLQLLDLRGDEPTQTFSDELQSIARQQTMQSLRRGDENKAGVVNGLQPTEFKAKMGLAFLASQIALFIVIAGLFIRIENNNGLPLPSSNQFIRQLLENYLPIAIGTSIEPFWVVLNRHLCFLQPFEELRHGRKAGEKSLHLEYSSLPPQLTIVKAWSNGNILLGVVCTMALLANGLSVSLSSLFFESTVDLETTAIYVPRYNPQFLPLDGAVGPFITIQGQSLESAYIATSNRTAHTPLPPWTDDRLFYFPFHIDAIEKNTTNNYRAFTPVIGAQLDCQPLSSGSEFEVTGNQKDEVGQYSIPATGNLTVSIVQDGGREVKCIPRGQNVDIVFGQPTGPSAYEFAYALDGISNSSATDASFCREHIAAGWVRSTLIDGVTPADQNSDIIQSIISSHTETIITCRSTLVAGTADVLVSADGHIQKRYSENTTAAAAQSFLSTTPSDLVGQVHQIILDDALFWHNDSLPSDFLNYLIELATNSSAHLDPTKPPPSLESIVVPFSALYSQLFATLIGSNMDQLLKPAKSKAAVTGYIVQPTIRIFMSKSMFIVAETILVLYIIVTIALYLRRPWKILCRMPTSLASIISFFAASHVVEDFRRTAGNTTVQLRDHIEKLDDQYGFGTFIGTDGKAHVGIEKYPFLAPLIKEGGGLDRQNSNDSKSSLRDEWRSKFVQWRSGKVREGGWM